MTESFPDSFFTKPTNIVFATGSQVYGTPEPYSDVDLVVLMTRDLAELLHNAMPGTCDTFMFEGRSATVFRVGKLNLICLHTANALAAWEKAKKICYDARPVTRDQAIEIHKRILAEMDVEPNY